MRNLPSSWLAPPIALQKGGEVRLHALCVSSVAATKSAKDKGFSRIFIGVFMWAKVGRKELCQGGGSFGVSDERRDFELGDRDGGALAA